MPEKKKANPETVDPIDMIDTPSIREVINDEVNAIRIGRSNPAKGNAIANLIGKLIQTVRLDIEVHRYVSTGKKSVKGLLNTSLEK